MSGTLFGVGVGPGDPDLVTLKAVRVLERAPVVAYPATKPGVSMARRIVAAHLGSEKTEIEIVLGMGSAARETSLEAYDRAAAAIAAHLSAGRDVAVLCEGDPMLFGSFIYLMERLGDAHPVEVVPGISSVMAAAAALRQPLAVQEDRFLIVPATRSEAELEEALRGCDGAVVMKIGRHLAKMRRILARLGLEERARLVERASTPQERTFPFASVTEETAPYFSLIVISKKDCV